MKLGRPKIEESPAVCPLGDRCGGCGWIRVPYPLQLEQKVRRVSDLIQGLLTVTSATLDAPIAVAPTFEIRSAGQTHLRDRADLVWEGAGDSIGLGLFAARADGDVEMRRPELVDIEYCEQMSAELAAFYVQIRGLFLNAPEALRRSGRQSIRLRVGPRPELRGVWLDFSNILVRDLFAEQIWLRSLASIAHVEIGQRQKRLMAEPDRLRLVDPVLEPWFETTTRSGARIPLFGTIAGFSQAGFAANRSLVEAVRELAGEGQGMLEFCSGNGNLSFALAENFQEIVAVEQNEIALNGFRLSQNLVSSRADLKLGRIEGLRGNIFRMDAADIREEIRDKDVLLFDPPRSGLGKLGPLVLEALEGRSPKIVYVSCYEESWGQDVAEFLTAGYRIEKIILVDQFAQGPHVEIVSLLTRG